MARSPSATMPADLPPAKRLKEGTLDFAPSTSSRGIDAPLPDSDKERTGQFLVATADGTKNTLSEEEAVVDEDALATPPNAFLDLQQTNHFRRSKEERSRIVADATQRSSLPSTTLDPNTACYSTTVGLGGKRHQVSSTSREKAEAASSLAQRNVALRDARPSLRCECGYVAACLYKLERHRRGRDCGSDSLTRMIEKSKAKYPGSFTYDEMQYSNGLITDIACVKHGKFKTRNHLTTSFGGCPGCVDKPSFKVFEERARATHDDEFDYDERSYSNMSSVVTMTHRKCGRALCIKACDHIRSTGCIECWKTPTPMEPIIADLTPFEAKVLPHPVHKSYGWDVDKRRVVNLKTSRVLNDRNRKRKGWYKAVELYTETGRKKPTSEHIFLYECFHKVDATGTEIDHINNDHEDDRIQNLQRLTKRDHGRKTSASKEGETAKKIARTQGRSGIARNPTTGQEVEFESISDLADRDPQFAR